uniref:Exportin 5 n=1 Tax=Takifugu rubripes TaxID=31033 RepID=A0A674PND2_TAKRU
PTSHRIAHSMSGEVASLCEQLMAAVNVTMDPETSHIYRLEALKFCEEFKENNSLCVPCGLQLADKAQPAVVRHFGLQILEHVIKFRWNDMQQQEKVHLKECAMQLLSNGTLSILEEESHIKDVLSRIIVEMIKREWPQQWPDMLKEMEVLSSQGETQTELVMLILLRLAEDVIFFQTLPAQRRRDIQQKLTQNMDSIFRFMMTILRANVEELRKLVSEAFCRVAVSTLNTLAGYIDWVSLSYISSKYSEILEVLCLLLNEPELQLEAAECLVIAVRRKGKLEDRKPIMLLFDDVAIDCILSAAQVVEVVEQRYIFLKRLCQVLCALGGQLCALVANAKVSIPANLSKYLEALLAFTTHSSQFLKSSTLITWANLFRHETLSREEAVVQMAVRYLRACMTNFVKTGFPSKNDSPSCAYSRVDFDNDSDFNSFFNTFRAQQGDLVRGACRIAPHEAFQIASEWLRYEVTTPIDTGGSKSQTAEGMCSFLSPSVLQWEAVTTFMDCTVWQILKSVEEEVIGSMELLQAMLNYETSDPLIMSCVLTNISTLFPFATRRQQFLPRVFYKLFKAVAFKGGQENRVSWSRSVKNVRKHACSSFIKICRDFPQFILPYFDMFYNHVKNLFASDATLSQMEKCALMESLILISNQFKDFAKQKAFLDELMSSVVVQWASDEMKNVLCEPAAFLSYAGADQVVTESGEGTDTAGLNRVTFALLAMFAMVKRSRWPADQEEAKAGGFVVDYTPTGAPIHRNPGAALFLSFLPNLLALIRTHNNLFLPENMARLSETYGGTHDLMDFDKKTQPLENCDVPVYKTNLERMQGFFTTVYDYSFQILGNAGPCLQQEFYTVEGLARELASSAFVNLDHVPDHRLRLMIHILCLFNHFSMVLSCPQEYYDSVLCPLLGPMFAYMLQRLNVKWQVINQRTSEEVICQESEVTKEMLDEYLVRLVTRELLDFVCKSNIYMTLLTLSFTSLSWKDTTNCHRTASMVCWALLQQVVGGSLLPEAVTWFFTSVLRGLQFHGQHETCNATLSYLAMLIYDNLRPRFVELRAVMAQIPNISVEALDQYDHRLIDPNAQKVGEKRRKDQFKKLIAGTVEKALCQQFRKEVHVRNLPSLFKKQKTDKDIMSSEAIFLTDLFFSQSNTL